MLVVARVLPSALAPVASPADGGWLIAASPRALQLFRTFGSAAGWTVQNADEKFSIVACRRRWAPCAMLSSAVHRMSVNPFGWELLFRDVCAPVVWNKVAVACRFWRVKESRRAADPRATAYGISQRIGTTLNCRSGSILVLLKPIIRMAAAAWDPDSTPNQLPPL